MTNVVSDVAKQVSARVDLRELLPRLVAGWQPVERGQLREVHSACPKCGGHDRFYVSANYAACRQCHSERMDAAGVVAWLHGCTMRAAVAMLDSGALRHVATVAAPDSARQRQTGDFARYAAPLLLRAQKLLYDDAGRQGRDYLLSRGLQPDTWRQFGLGFTPSRRLTKDRSQVAPAVVWPVYDVNGQLTAVRYRYCVSTPTGDRYDSLAGSSTVNCLFGSAALPAYVMTPDDGRPATTRCLFVSEGEFNAMSAWQATHQTNVDVVSFCSESQRKLPAWCLDVASCYSVVIVWIDDDSKAQDVARQLPQAQLLRSPVVDGHKFDANSMLLAGRLGALLQNTRLRGAAGASLRESILWQLYDARQHLDDGQVDVARRLARELGRSFEEE